MSEALLKADASGKVAVAQRDELPPGARKIVRIERNGKPLEIGVFNVGGRLVAYRNVCPHAAAPVCLGKVCGTTLPSQVGEYILAREGEILRCPWHGWEFDLFTGRHLVDEKMKLRAYPVDAGGEAGTSDDLTPYDVVDENHMIYVVVP